MKNKKLWSINEAFLFPVSAISCLVFLLFSFVCYFVVTLKVQSKFEHRLNYYQNLYMESITNDVLVGLDHETYRKCKSFFKDEEVRFIEIVRPGGNTICSLKNKGFDKEKLLFINTSIFFGEKSKEVAASLRIGYSVSFFKELAFQIIGILFLVLLFLATLQFIFFRLASQKVSNSITYISEQFEKGSIEHLNIPTDYSDSSIVEIRKLFNGLNGLVLKLKKYQKELIDNTKLEAFSQIATQVAHDIRSPLAALEMITADLDELEESKRIIIRGAVTRINDIANNLLLQNRSKESSSPNDELEVILISTLIDSVLTEKRMQFRDLIGVKINNNPENSSYGLFCEVHANELKRVCSNLLNNSVEILGKEGVVTVSLLKHDEKVRLIIQDNGKGIPPEVLSTLGKRGASHGKKEGNGLGLYHAISSVESWDGTLNIESIIDIGTSIIIDLPMAEAPKWFVSTVELKRDMEICILDDDESIHQIWDRRFSRLKLVKNNIKVNHFSSPKDIVDWYKLNFGKLEGGALFLMDYELLGHRKTGLDIIKELGIAKFSYLVTSRFEDKKILEDIETFDIGLIPKSMASEIPIIINKDDKEFEEAIDDKELKEAKDDSLNKEVATILLDDDLLINMIWKHSAKKNNINFFNYTTPEELFLNINNFSKKSTFYIDSSLSNDIKGEDVAKKIYDLGFKNIHLATGYEPEKFEDLDYIVSVIGKDTPW